MHEVMRVIPTVVVVLVVALVVVMVRKMKHTSTAAGESDLVQR